MVWQPSHRNCKKFKSSLERLGKKSFVGTNGLYLTVSVLWGNALGMQVHILLKARNLSRFRNGVEKFRS